ncbi:hypothetical protein BI364_02755 [Acidihalobacter yilgarnensis]|uniref:DUF4325 domain-containing protein n=1 Tax=Acidihalobacter yilgarnensis TaxID=2819280 RepID=A0A1D8IKR9_9GAMM|nr:STAS-like domain-containing protein [Acidihalobacter yilgarnensis]AOU97066.1 hypothetical protein BI364_02755 [Acidihalobacter yilgarnensis]
MTEISRDNHVIRVSGDLKDFHYLLAQFHQGIEKAAYSELILDMSECTSAFQNSMLSVCAQVTAYREAGIDIELIPPKNPRLLSLFRNTNWGYFLDPRKFDQSHFRGHSRIPATRYKTPDEQQNSVNRIVNIVLGALPDLQRSNLAAFEWSINEITDNVLLHSESPIGGLVQVSTFEKNTKSIQFVVADAGVGIPQTLKGGRPDITSDTDALDKAIREGVTRDAKIGQGNGLFGTFRVCSKSNGYFQVDSGHARLEFNSKNGLSISNQNIPYSGTLVVATIDFTDPDLLEDALQFGGKPYKPIDYLELEYEKSDGIPINFILINECQAFGSRVSGRPLRQKLHNILRMSGSPQIAIDFDGVPVVSSSFADEAFGKLFLQLGPVQFMQKVKLINMADTVEGLINKAIAQRMQYGASDIDP